MDFRLKPEEIVNIFSEIIKSEEFDASGKVSDAIYDRKEPDITKKISEIFNNNPVFKKQYDLYLHHQCKGCDLVFAEKSDKKYLKAKEDELWLEAKLYWEKSKWETASNQKNKIYKDIKKLKTLEKASKGFCILVFGLKEYPEETELKEIINELTMKTKAKYIIKSIKINTPDYSYCHILLWSF